MPRTHANPKPASLVTIRIANGVIHLGCTRLYLAIWAEKDARSIALRPAAIINVKPSSQVPKAMSKLLNEPESIIG